jgi:hypothetical protein
MYESHTVAGRVGSIRKAEVGGKKVINISLAVQQGKVHTVWWELAFWERLAENFEALSIDKGTVLIASVFVVFPDVYVDKEKKPKASIKCNVHTFRVVSKASDKSE